MLMYRLGNPIFRVHRALAAIIIWRSPLLVLIVFVVSFTFLSSKPNSICLKMSTPRLTRSSLKSYTDQAIHNIDNSEFQKEQDYLPINNTNKQISKELNTIGVNRDEKLKRKREFSEEDNLPKKKKKEKVFEPPKIVGDVDVFCWRCHKSGDFVKCSKCPRVFHLKCAELESKPIDFWPCIECDNIEKAEAISNRLLDVEELSDLLSFTVERMKSCPGSEHFCTPVDTNVYDNYKDYILKPMDISQLDVNVRTLKYRSTVSFLADAKWMVHNSYVYNSAQSSLTVLARGILKVARQECEEIENCHYCYKHAHTLSNEEWFIEPCEKPHLLIWARLTGFPYWPAKVMKYTGQGVDVRFFGDHNRSMVPPAMCLLYSKKTPFRPKDTKRPGYDKALEEIETHVMKLNSKFNCFVYAEYRTELNPRMINEYIAKMLPKLNLINTGDIKEVKQKEPTTNEAKEINKSHEDPKLLTQEPEKREMKNKIIDKVLLQNISISNQLGDAELAKSLSDLDKEIAKRKLTLSVYKEKLKKINSQKILRTAINENNCNNSNENIGISHKKPVASMDKEVARKKLALLALKNESQKKKKLERRLMNILSIDDSETSKELNTSPSELSVVVGREIRSGQANNGNATSLKSIATKCKSKPVFTQEENTEKLVQQNSNTKEILRTHKGPIFTIHSVNDEENCNNNIAQLSPVTTNFTNKEVNENSKNELGESSSDCHNPRISSVRLNKLKYKKKDPNNTRQLINQREIIKRLTINKGFRKQRLSAFVRKLKPFSKYVVDRSFFNRNPKFTYNLKKNLKTRDKINNIMETFPNRSSSEQSSENMKTTCNSSNEKINLLKKCYVNCGPKIDMTISNKQFNILLDHNKNICSNKFPKTIENINDAAIFLPKNYSLIRLDKSLSTKCVTKATLIAILGAEKYLNCEVKLKKLSDKEFEYYFKLFKESKTEGRCDIVTISVDEDEDEVSEDFLNNLTPKEIFNIIGIGVTNNFVKLNFIEFPCGAKTTLSSLFNSENGTTEHFTTNLKTTESATEIIKGVSVIDENIKTPNNIVSSVEEISSSEEQTVPPEPVVPEDRSNEVIAESGNSQNNAETSNDKQVEKVPTKHLEESNTYKFTKTSAIQNGDEDEISIADSSNHKDQSLLSNMTPEKEFESTGTALIEKKERNESSENDIEIAKDFKEKTCNFLKNIKTIKQMKEVIEFLDKIFAQLSKSICDLEEANTLNKDINRLHAFYETEIQLKQVVENIKKDYDKYSNELMLELKKTKLWCASCKNASRYYCCWYASYCSHNCQVKHWSIHYKVCVQCNNNSPIDPVITSNQKYEQLSRISTILNPIYIKDLLSIRSREDKTHTEREENVAISHEDGKEEQSDLDRQATKHFGPEIDLEGFTDVTPTTENIHEIEHLQLAQRHSYLQEEIDETLEPEIIMDESLEVSIGNENTQETQTLKLQRQSNEQHKTTQPPAIEGPEVISKENHMLEVIQPKPQQKTKITQLHEPDIIDLEEREECNSCIKEINEEVLNVKTLLQKHPYLRIKSPLSSEPEIIDLEDTPEVSPVTESSHEVENLEVLLQKHPHLQAKVETVDNRNKIVICISDTNSDKFNEKKLRNEKADIRRRSIIESVYKDHQLNGEFAINKEIHTINSKSSETLNLINGMCNVEISITNGLNKESIDKDKSSEIKTISNSPIRTETSGTYKDNSSSDLKFIKSIYKKSTKSKFIPIVKPDVSFDNPLLSKLPKNKILSKFYDIPNIKDAIILTKTSMKPTKL